MKSLLFVYVIISVACSTVPDHMRAAVIIGGSSDTNLDLFKVMDSVPVPKVDGNKVLIKVLASSINPIDWKLDNIGLVGAALRSYWSFSGSYPLTVGFDFAGVIVAKGPSASDRLSVGDEVWGYDASVSAILHHGGTWAEYAAVDDSVVSKMPTGLEFKEAGAMPLVGLTAYGALTWAGKKEGLAGKTLVVLGGSGGVGHVAVQIAKALGASKVISTCSASNIDLVKSLGADTVYDYHTVNWYEEVADRSVDVVFDTIGLKGTGDQAFPKLAHGGMFVTTLPDGMPCTTTRLGRWDASSLTVSASGHVIAYDKMDALGRMVADKKLHAVVDKSFDLAQTTDALKAQATGHTVGKMVITMDQQVKEKVALDPEIRKQALIV